MAKGEIAILSSLAFGHNIYKSCLLDKLIVGIGEIPTRFTAGRVFVPVNVEINPFPHKTILQQTTLNLFCQLFCLLQRRKKASI